MVLTYNDALNTTLSILNTHVVDDFNGTRIGSFFWNEDLELNFTRFMPKGQVIGENHTLSNITYGRPYNRDEEYRLNIFFFVKHNDVGSASGLKNRQASNYYIEQIKNTILTNSGSYGASAVTFDTIERPIYAPDQQIYITNIPLIIKVKRNNTV